MRFRELRQSDVEAIRARSTKEYDKLPDPEQCEDAIVAVDENGEPRLVMKAQRVAELYVIMDHDWNTPAMRWAMLEQAHRKMRSRLNQKGYKMAYSFFADGVPAGYLRRLIPLGWDWVRDRCLRFVEGGAR
jgi:hypothetical protein